MPQAEMSSARILMHSQTNIASFEIDRERYDKAYFLGDRENYCAPHFHSNIEIIAVQTNEQVVQINNDKRVLTAGQLAISDSFDIHSYLHSEGTLSSVLVIPSFYLNDYNTYKKAQRLRTNFVYDKDVFDQCLPLMHKIGSISNSLLLKGYINQLLAIITEKCGFTDITVEEKKDIDFIRQVLEYVHDHLTEDISLKSIAQAFSYSTSHFSRKFNNLFGCSISEYINNARLSKLFELRENYPDKKLITLIMESGFRSIPTFYRYFTERTSLSPAKFFANVNESTPPPPLQVNVDRIHKIYRNE